MLKKVHFLLKEQGMTIKGAKKILNNEPLKLDEISNQTIRTINLKNKILNISKSIVEFNVTKQLRQKENPKELWLAFSPIKSNYFNFMIQKATELGVTKFLPVIFERTIVRKINIERLKKVIIEAAEQSNRIIVPIIEEPQIGRAHV